MLTCNKHMNNVGFFNFPSACLFFTGQYLHNTAREGWTIFWECYLVFAQTSVFLFLCESWLHPVSTLGIATSEP